MLELLTYEERISYFEAFWEYETPRVGEPGALGWNHWQFLFKQGGAPNTEDAQPFPPGTIASSKHVVAFSKNATSRFIILFVLRFGQKTMTI